MASYYEESISDYAAYWEPPRIKATVEWALIDTITQNRSDSKRKYMFTGVKVDIAGEWYKLNIRTDGLDEEIRQALDKIINNREIKEEA